MKPTPNVFIVGTPIGNLGDMTRRAVETLASVDAVYAEDTRTAAALLNHLDIKKPIHSCHKDNELSAAKRIAGDAVNGKSVAVISEAGMPGVSDPGMLVVRHLRDEGIPFEVIPGTAAILPALLYAAFSTDRFYFHGFLPHKKKDRIADIERIRHIPALLVFYESPHRVKETLSLLLELLPAPVAVCRELTKLHEETVYVSTEEDIESLMIKGEFVLVVDNAGAEPADSGGGVDLEAVGKAMADTGASARDIAQVLKSLGLKRNDAYARAQELVEGKGDKGE